MCLLQNTATGIMGLKLVSTRSWPEVKVLYIFYVMWWFLHFNHWHTSLQKPFSLLLFLNFSWVGMWVASFALFSLCLIPVLSSLAFYSLWRDLFFFFLLLEATAGDFCLGIHFKCSLYFAGPCCGNTLQCLRLPALQQIMWCHQYLVCTARGLRNLNKQTDKNIISTGHSQHVAAALFTCDARHLTPMSALTSSSKRSSHCCE